jgi:nucleoside-diphosphate-sugar epimerase
MQTILGANGVIGKNIAKALPKYTSSIRLVSRDPKPIGGNEELFQADLTDWKQTIHALKGSKVAYLAVGLNYSTEVWQKEWPLIMTNVINACKEHGTNLVFFDNVYCYGKQVQNMLESTPFNPCSKKGEIRANIATQLLQEISLGNINAQIARSADFYGPDSPMSFLNMLVFEHFAKKKSAQWMIADSFKHSFTYTPDAGLACAILGNSENAYGQTWHLPTYSEVLTGREMIQLIAVAFACAPNYSILKNWMLQMAGLFNPIVRETIEMQYQMDRDYVFNSEKFCKEFTFIPTSYKRGVVDTVNTY